MTDALKMPAIQKAIDDSGDDWGMPSVYHLSQIYKNLLT
ncbi:hypothetical protein BJV40_002430 [Clostridium beijerinckii]|nr:hypothetical protein [Clostridium beijerinckii]